MGGFLGKSFFNVGEKEELRHENEKLKVEISMIKQNAERANEEQRASNAEAASLKEELTLTKDALEEQKRRNRLMHERGLAQLQQGNSVEVQNVDETTLRLPEIQVLTASIESKELVVNDLRSRLRHVQRDLENTQNELTRSHEREEIKTSEAAWLERRCRQLVIQITGLIDVHKECEERITHLEEENKILSITNQLFSLD